MPLTMLAPFGRKMAFSQNLLQSCRFPGLKQNLHDLIMQSRIWGRGREDVFRG